jgi:haloalkane dehalogenase
MEYIEAGQGDPVVFLHGNPTSSYLWRNIIPFVQRHGRCLAPDLIGMGESGKTPDGAYRFVDHVRYLDDWFEELNLSKDVTLVGHDWGGALSFYWAYRFPARVKAIIYMETIVQPLGWSMWPQDAVKIFQAMRSPSGEEIVLERNLFVNRILPASIIRNLTDEEMEAYRRPYLEEGESRRPVLSWPREIPIDGEPADVTQIVSKYGEWLATSSIPKLFINAEPGSILVGEQREFCRTWANQEEVTVEGIHFIQEDSPAEIGQAIAGFVSKLR